LETDLNNLIKSTKYDLSKFPQEWINRFKRFSPKGELYVIPAEVPKDASSTVTPYMLVYNKDIFDKFAVPYPKDNMTWDEAVELAKRFNRTDGGIQYRGLQIQNYADVMVMANNPKYIDENGTVETTTDPKWTDHLRILRAAYEANGNWLPFPGQVDEWAKNANVAMFAGQAGAFIFKPEAYPDLHWDLATYPIFRKGEPGIPGFDAISVFAIASTSEHKALVWDLINTFQSPEFAKGKPNDWENPVLLTKNTKAYTGVQLSPYTRGMWDQPVTTILRKKLAQFLNEGKDSNTILREIKEEEEKKIAELKQ
jgi:multiple sugar transport system substrate-binding protein